MDLTESKYNSYFLEAQAPHWSPSYSRRVPHFLQYGSCMNFILDQQLGQRLTSSRILVRQFKQFGGIKKSAIAFQIDAKM